MTGLKHRDGRDSEVVMSYSYHRERSYSSRSGSRSSSRRRFKESLIIITIVLAIIIALMFVCLKLWQGKNELQNSLVEKSVIVKTYEQELSILRTLNPYHVGSSEVLQEAVNNIDLFPGWITRVYPLPENHEKAMYMMDLGSFVMNETRFSLSSHQRYGIPKPNKSMYRMNGLMPSHVKGRHQIGIEFYINDRKLVVAKDKSGIGSCYARVDVNQKRVIDKHLRIFTRYNTEQMLTGEVELNKGLFPISAVFYCDKRSDFNGADVEVAISFRQPNQSSLSVERNSIFHIYNPQGVTAKL